MLTFKDCSFEERKGIPDKAKDIIEYYGENAACCFFDGILILRLFDGEGYFFSLYKTEERAALINAIEQIREYAIKEEIGLTFKNIAPSELGVLLSAFDYAEIVSQDRQRLFYTVRIQSEAMRLCELPRVLGERITLAEIGEKDAPDYERLCMEESALEFWGYDYRLDGDIPDGYFYNMQRAEFERGTSLTLGAYMSGKLIGEGSFYAFDYKGGAEIAFRLLPEYRGQGLGRELLELLLSVAEELSLSAVYATVNKNNTVSLRLLSDYMDTVSSDGEILHLCALGEEE